MSISLTDAAADRVRTYIQDRSAAVGVGLGVKVVGCSGYAYVVDVAEQVNDDDTVFESKGVKVVVNGKSLPIVDGTEIDFTKEGLNEGFAYHNPNARNMCGCGESFGV